MMTMTAKMAVVVMPLTCRTRR